MNPDMNDTSLKKPKTSVPAWVWIFSAVAAALSVVISYFAGNMGAQIAKTLFIADKNGESTELAVLDFNNFLYAFDGEQGYNRLDSVYYSLSYSSTRHFSNVSGTYDNEYFGDCKFSASFINFNYYEVAWIYDPSAIKLNISFESNIESGNFEARIYTLDKNYRVSEDENGMMYVRPEYLQMLYSYGANNEYYETVYLSDSYYYILVTASEGASGSYNFSASTAL